MRRLKNSFHANDFFFILYFNLGLLQNRVQSIHLSCYSSIVLVLLCLSIDPMKCYHLFVFLPNPSLSFSIHAYLYFFLSPIHFVIISPANYFFSQTSACPVDCFTAEGYDPHTHPMSFLDMTLNNLMVRFQQCWSFGECGVSLHCHCSQVHYGPEW